MRKDAKHGRGSGNRGRRGKRMFGYGDLRLLVLTLVSEQPRHGYELIKLIKERFEGSYAPSPGAIYPTIEWLNELGFVEVSEGSNGRKCATISESGKAFLKANQAIADDLWKRRRPDYRKNAPAEIVEAMDTLKLAIRGTLEQSNSSEVIASIATRIQSIAAEIAKIEDDHASD